jgi:TolB-like protein/Tfp pilus assembly protein PilF
MELNPHHPGWYRFTTFFDLFLKGEDDKALEVAQKINMPGYYGALMVEVLAHTRLGNTAAAENAAREMLRAYPAEDMRGYGRFAEMWFYSQPDLLNEVISVLRSAGVEVDSPGGEDSTPAPVSGASTAAASPISAKTEPQLVAIAVLPFSDMSPDKDQDYFCEGMAEEIMNSLVRIEGIRVASRTSAFRARHEGHGLAEIARLLSVSHVLEGSVRTAGSRLRVTAQLTDVVSGHQLWSERFDRELEDIFAVQDEISAGVVDAVRARLAPEAGTIPSRPQPHNLEAYRSYLLGQHLRYAKEDHGGAVRAFQEAIRLDPTHAPSWTGLAEGLALSAHMSLIPADEACTGARKALSIAMELQGESADGLHGEAFVAFIERRWEDLEAAVRRAIELQPSHVPSLGLLGMCLSLHQKPDEAEPFFERARQADPLASFPYMLTALGLLTAGRPQEAHGYAEQALTFEKEDASALFCSSLAKIAMGRFEEGIAAAEHGVAVSHRGSDFVGLLGWALASGGRKDDARTLLEELRTRPAAAPQIVSEGWLLGALGELDAAFDVFARAEDQHQLWLYYTGLPSFDSLRSDRRFAELVERLGLPPSPSASVETSPVETKEISEESIAVLPFVNMSANQEDEYFSDGLSEEIINALTRIPDLRVIARTSAFRFRGEQDLRAVGEALGVRNVLEGSVRRAGEQLRITAQLIDVADDSHIWSERFDREMTDVFLIQDEIADAIAQKLHVSFGSSAPIRRQSENVAAYEALLEGRYYFFQFTPKAAERALACLRRSLSLEPDYPDALVEHGFYHLMMAYMFSDPRDELPHVRALAERALQRDPGHGEAQAAVAVMEAFLDRNWSASEISFRRALELSPASARVHELYGLCCLLGQGRFSESLAELDRAIELDPLSALYAGNRGRVLTCSRQFAEAEASCRRGLALDPGQLLAQVEFIYALLFQDKFDEAIAVGKRAVETHGPVNAPRQALALSHALAGQREEAFQLVNETAEPGAGYRSPLALGLVHAAFSEMDEAFADVERSLDELDPLLTYLAVHPMFDNLRADPRYVNLLARMNLSERGSS